MYHWAGESTEFENLPPPRIQGGTMEAQSPQAEKTWPEKKTLTVIHFQASAQYLW